MFPKIQTVQEQIIRALIDELYSRNYILIEARSEYAEDNSTVSTADEAIAKLWEFNSMITGLWFKQRYTEKIYWIEFVLSNTFDVIHDYMCTDIVFVRTMDEINEWVREQEERFLP